MRWFYLARESSGIQRSVACLTRDISQAAIAISARPAEFRRSLSAALRKGQQEVAAVRRPAFTVAVEG